MLPPFFSFEHACGTTVIGYRQDEVIITFLPAPCTCSVICLHLSLYFSSPSIFASSSSLDSSSSLLCLLQYASGGTGHEQPPTSGHQPPHHPRHRGHKAFGKKEAGALDMDTLADASAAASLLTVLLEQSLSEAQQSQLTPVLR